MRVCGECVHMRTKFSMVTWSWNNLPTMSTKFSTTFRMYNTATAVAVLLGYLFFLELLNLVGTKFSTKFSTASCSCIVVQV